MLEISIEKNCPIKNIPIKKLTEKFPDFKANILGTVRKEKFIYLKKNDQMLEDDNVYVVVSSDQLNPILKAFGHEEKTANSIVIAGGGQIGQNTVNLLNDKMKEINISIIENNRDQANILAEIFSNISVINGDALDQDILTEAYVDYKLEQGYDPMNIFSKTRSLKGVLEPFSTQGNIDLLKRAGFLDIVSIQKYLSFEGFLGIK